MWDGWEERYDCAQRAVAFLFGYRRAFNKPSIVNWGTKVCPCPTLNLVTDSSASCAGIAFEFPAEKKIEVEEYISYREGKGFRLAQVEIAVGANSYQAHTPLYTGSNIINDAEFDALLSNIGNAKGTSGACIDYVVGISNELSKIGIKDPAVSELMKRLGLD